MPAMPVNIFLSMSRYELLSEYSRMVSADVVYAQMQHIYLLIYLHFLLLGCCLLIFKRSKISGRFGFFCTYVKIVVKRPNFSSFFVLHRILFDICLSPSVLPACYAVTCASSNCLYDTFSLSSCAIEPRIKFPS